MLTLLLLLLLKRVDVTDTVVNAETREGAIKSQRSEDSSGEKNAIRRRVLLLFAAGACLIVIALTIDCGRWLHALEPRGVDRVVVMGDD